MTNEGLIKTLGQEHGMKVSAVFCLLKSKQNRLEGWAGLLIVNSEYM
jgi:hypothetical protein